MSLSQLFESYASEYNDISGKIQQAAQELPELTGVRKRQAATELKEMLGEAEATLKKMKMELSSLPPNISQPLRVRYQKYAEDLDQRRKECDTAQVALPREKDARGALLGIELEVSSSGHRDQIRNNTKTLVKSSEQLRDAKKILSDTHEVADNIMVDLDNQHKKIDKTHSTLRRADENVAIAQGVMRTMMRRIATNKLITAAVILVLLGLIGYLLYAMFFSGGSTPPPHTGSSGSGSGAHKSADFGGGGGGAASAWLPSSSFLFGWVRDRPAAAAADAGRARGY